jgi:hypothetical protein
MAKQRRRFASNCASEYTDVHQNDTTRSLIRKRDSCIYSQYTVDLFPICSSIHAQELRSMTVAKELFLMTEPKVLLNPRSPWR